MADDGEEPWTPALTSPSESEAQDPQMPFSWDDLEEGAAGLLTAAYILVRQEVGALHALVHGHPGGVADLTSPRTPPLPQIKEALRLAKAELQAISQMFSL